jgi:prepilin-type N-terminal cleavage/methylation domain-containing protein
MSLRDEAGFTLVELIIGVIIMTLLTLGIYVFMHNLEDVSHAAAARTQLQQEGSLILEDIVKDIREADTITIGDVEGGTSNYILIESPTISTVSYWSVEGDPDAGHQEGELYKNEGGNDLLLAGDYNQGGVVVNVNDLIFSDNLAANLVTIDLNLQMVRINPDLSTTTLEVVTFSASAEPRNR